MAFPVAPLMAGLSGLASLFSPQPKQVLQPNAPTQLAPMSFGPFNSNPLTGAQPSNIAPNAYEEFASLGGGSPLLGAAANPNTLASVMSPQLNAQHFQQKMAQPAQQYSSPTLANTLQSLSPIAQAAADIIKPDKKPSAQGQQPPTKEVAAAAGAAGAAKDIAKAAIKDSDKFLGLSGNQMQAIGAAAGVLANLFKQEPKQQLQINRQLPSLAQANPTQIQTRGFSAFPNIQSPGV